MVPGAEAVNDGVFQAGPLELRHTERMGTVTAQKASTATCQGCVCQPGGTPWLNTQRGRSNRIPGRLQAYRES
jgi:hypothetical protein